MVFCLMPLKGRQLQSGEASLDEMFACAFDPPWRAWSYVGANRRSCLQRDQDASHSGRGLV